MVFILEYDDLILDDRSKYGWIPCGVGSRLKKTSLLSSEIMGARWYPKLKKRAVCWNNFLWFTVMFADDGATHG